MDFFYLTFIYTETCFKFNFNSDKPLTRKTLNIYLN